MRSISCKVELVALNDELVLLVPLNLRLGEHISKVEHVRRKHKVRVEGEPLRLFLPATCQTIAGERCRAQKLYSTYTAWCNSRNEPRISKPAFKAAMTALGFSQIRSNGIHWEGIRLRDDWSLEFNENA